MPLRLAALARGICNPCSVFAALKRYSNSTPNPAPPHPMARRTVRKLTVWSADEWRSVEDAARPSGVPPLRFVREAALELV